MVSSPTVLREEGKYHQEKDKNKERRKRGSRRKKEAVGRVLNGVPEKDMHIYVSTEKKMLIFTCIKKYKI